MHDLLNYAQHGFTAGQSVVTNLLRFNAAVASIISRNHAYDITSVDFKKAFGKLIPYCVWLSSLTTSNLSPMLQSIRSMKFKKK